MLSYVEQGLDGVQFFLQALTTWCLHQYITFCMVSQKAKAKAKAREGGAATPKTAKKNK